MLNSAKRRWSKKYLWYSPQNIFFNDIVLEKYKCTAVSHPLLQVIFHGLSVHSMQFSGLKVPQASLLEMSKLAPHVQCSHKHCYVAHCGMPLSPIHHALVPRSSMQVSLLSSFCDNSHNLVYLKNKWERSSKKKKTCKCPFYPHSATIPTHSISLWQVRLSCRTQNSPNIINLKSKTWPHMPKNLN